MSTGNLGSPFSLSEHYEYGNGMVHHLEGRMKTLRQQLSNHIDECLLEAFSEILHISNSHALKDKKRDSAIKPLERKKEGLIEKQFTYRRSTFSELFDISHFRTLQNIFVAVIICWVVSTAINDATAGGTWQAALPQLELVHWAFGNCSFAIYAWLLLMLAAMAVFPLFQLWICCRDNFVENQQAIDVAFLGLWILYEVACIAIPCRNVIIKYDLALGSAMALALEQTRLVMKMHAFVRENVRRVFRKVASPVTKPEDELGCDNEFDRMNSTIDGESGQEVRRRRLPSRSSPLETRSRTNSFSVSPNKSFLADSQPQNESHSTSFGCYLYFLFAPTLIYRDNYPQTSHINWWFVFSNFSQVILCIMYSYYLISRYMMPEVTALASAEEVSVSLFLGSWCRCTTPGVMLFVLGFYGFLHSWLNAWAEMLRFGDREFYKDWWNAVSFSAYYRDWNRVVHDFLYIYVFSDVITILGAKRKALAVCLVFFLSCFFHEYILVTSLRFYMPFFEFSMFITAVLSLTVTPKASNRNRPLNVALWIGMIFGNALMVCLFTMEWAARKRYESAFPKNKILDIFVPRLIISLSTSPNVTTLVQ